MYPKISIAIPTYEMGGKGHEIIQYALASLLNQTFKDFEVVISDQSEDTYTEQVCQAWQSHLNIKYVKYPYNKGCYTANTNNAVKYCTGEIIKYLDADDFLFDNTSMLAIYEAFGKNVNWLMTRYVHSEDRETWFKSYLPVWNPRIYVVNTLGSPSALAVRRECVLPMDENLRWMGDADLYKQLFDKWGKPAILDIPTVVHLLWPGQTSTVLSELERKETEYVIRKYEGDGKTEKT